jgi:hypothetical protein
VLATLEAVACELVGRWAGGQVGRWFCKTLLVVLGWNLRSNGFVAKHLYNPDFVG